MKHPLIYLSLILVLAAVLRLYHLDSNPPAAYGDEISFAWNAWSILKTGTDEYGTPYPLQFRAFNDYKPPLPVYLLVPFLKVLGLTTFAVRLPVALFSITTVWLTFLVMKKLLGIKIGLLTAFLMAISPWHIHLSRGFFESTLALFIFLGAIYFFLKVRERPFSIIFSSIFFALSLYTYFTPRILLPVFIPFLVWLSRHEVFKYKKLFILAAGIFFLLSIPLVKMTIWDSGSNRMQFLMEQRMEKAAEEATYDQSISASPLLIKKLLYNKYIAFVRLITNDYLEHFSIQYWYLYGDNSLRYFLGKMGMFYLFELPFLIIGLYIIWKKNVNIAIFLFGWLLMAPIPAALVGRSFAVRSLAMLPVPFAIVAAGIVEIFKPQYKIKPLKYVLVIFTACTLGVSLFQYLSRYYFDYPTYAATWWGWENKAAFDYAKSREANFDTIFISEFYTGAALAYAFYSQLDPLEYRQAVTHPITIADNRTVVKIGKYYFGSLDIDAQRLEQNILPANTLYLGRPEEADGQATITAPVDGRVLFKIHTSKKPQ